MKAILRPVILSLIVCSTTWVSMAMADEPGVTSIESMGDTGPSGRSVMRDYSGYAVAPPFGLTYHLEGVFGQGIGWEDNYYQGGIFMPHHLDPGRSLLFTAINAAGTEDTQGIVNLGFGARHYHRNWDRIFGLSGWYDYDGGHGDDYHRLGLSFESLGKYFDFRANGYFLLDSDPNEVSNQFIGDPFFRENHIIALREIITEFPYDGADVEVGGPLPFLGRYGFYGNVGAYYLHSDDDVNSVGWKTRLDVAVTDDVSVGVNMSKDDVFGTNVYTSVAWQFPDGRPRRWFKPRPVRERLNTQVARNERISVRRERDVNGEPLINPADLEPIFVVHVDPNSAAAGDGTFENPYRLMESARGANVASIDIFRIVPRSDDTGTNLAMAGPFNLFDNQRVLGATMEHTVTAVQGVFDFPGQVMGELPIVSNGLITPGISVFNLADGNEISAIEINARNAANTASGNGIGNLAAIVDFNLNRNEFRNHVNAVNLAEATGDGLFSDNTMTGTLGLSANGLRIINNAGTLDLEVEDNSASGHDNTGYYVEASGTATINSDVTGNSATNNANGFILTSSGGDHNIDFDNNIADMNIGDDPEDAGAVFSSSGGTTNVDSLTANDFTSNRGHNVAFIANDVAGGGTVNVDDFTGNTITGSGTGNTTANLASGVYVSADGATSTVDINIGEAGATANEITGNGAGTGSGHGIQIATSNDGTVQGSIVNNNISDQVGGFGISVDANSGTVDFGTLPTRLISTNLIDGNVDAGIGIRLAGDSTGRFIISENEITNTTDGANPLFDGDGIHVRTEDTSILALLTIEDNLIGVNSVGGDAGNAGDGVKIELYQFSQAPDVNIQSNFVQFNGQNGVHFNRNGDAFLDDVLIDDNVLSDNSLSGLFLDMRGGDIDVPGGGGPLVMNFTITNNLAQRNATGMTFSSIADADVSLFVDNNLITFNEDDGINATTDNFAQIRGTISNNDISDNGDSIGDHGIQLADGNSPDVSFDLDIDTNFVERNFDDGINFTAIGDGMATVDIMDNFIRNNGGDGVDVITGDQAGNTFNASVSTINLVDNTISGNAESGVEMLAWDLTTLNTTSSGNVIQGHGDDGWAFTTGQGVLNAAFLNASLTDNIIRFNDGRGVDILNQGNSDMDIEILGTVDPRPNANVDSSLIDSNGLQGILVVNFADPTLAADLSNPINRTDNNINFRLFQTEVRGNGVNALADDDGNGVYLLVGTSAFGEVNAALEDNHFSGNTNIDVVTESFVATADPPVVNPFTDAANFVPDPLARLNFRLQGNVGQQIDVTRIGAFYDNPDPFKSVLGQGPLFESITRRRNAQALPSDIAALGSPSTVTAAPAPAAATFGASTNIVTADPPNQLVNALVEFTSGGLIGEIQQINATTDGTPDTLTVASDFTAPPLAGDAFTITAIEQAGTGASTFVTEDANIFPNNTFDTYISDFNTAITFPDATGDEAIYPYTWTTGAVFPPSPWP